ncbi:MAG: T9SS type A sorting domain-containing protein [Bacteroidota bacterium]
MKKFILPLIIISFGFIPAIGQGVGTIFVTGSGNDFVYVDNTYIYTTDEVRISNPTSFVYLRRDGQLLQSGNVANRGLGFLSVYQEGSVNNYQYNYWCSPVGVPSAGIGNKLFGLSGIYNPTSVTSSTIASVTSSYDGTASPFAVSDSWIYKFQASSLYTQWLYTGATTTLLAGEGFTMKGTSGTDATTILGVQNNSGSKQRYDFRGRPNNGDITINLLDQQRTLTGNPYSSTIDLSAFLTDATNSTGVAYFWEHDKTANSHYLASYRGGYGTFSPVSRGGTGIYVPATYATYDGAGNNTGVYSNPNNTFQRRFCPIGQGFMIEGNASGTTATMSNIYRVYVKEGAATFSEFEKGGAGANDFLPEIASVSGFDYTTVSTAGVPQIKFNTLLDNQGIRQMVLAFDPAATDGMDHAMDALTADTDIPSDAFFVVDDKNVVIDVINFDIDKKIPVGFKNNEEANFKITVKEIINFTGADNVYLHDKISDMYFDIKNNFYETVLPAGINTTQYEITFKNGKKPYVAIGESSIKIGLSNATNVLTIQNPEKITLATCSLYDVVGKQIFVKNVLGANESYEFPVSGLSEGIYIVRLNMGSNTEMSKKIMIKK